MKKLIILAGIMILIAFIISIHICLNSCDKEKNGFEMKVTSEPLIEIKSTGEVRSFTNNFDLYFWELCGDKILNLTSGEVTYDFCETMDEIKQAVNLAYMKSLGEKEK